MIVQVHSGECTGGAGSHTHRSHGWTFQSMVCQCFNSIVTISNCTLKSVIGGKYPASIEGLVLLFTLQLRSVSP